MQGDSDVIFRNNLAAVGAALAATVSVHSPSAQARLDDGVEPTASVCQADGRWVRLHSARDPVAEADRLIAPLFSGEPPPTVVVIGVGLGFVLDAIERRSPGTRVLALEPIPDIVGLMLRRKDWRPWFASGRLMLLAGPEYLGWNDAWSLIDARRPSPPVVVHPVVAREFSQATSLARNVAHRVVDGARANANAKKAFAPRYLINTLSNLAGIATEASVDALRGKFEGVPAIVAAAGPSLDRNIEDLKAMEFRGLLVAVDTAVRPLLTAGLQPQVVVGVDPSDENGRHLMDLPPNRGVFLVGEGSLAAFVIPAFAGRAFVFRVSDHHPWPWIRTHSLDCGSLRAWGSVLTTAFDFAVFAGCDPIVFIGADLAYTNDLVYCWNTTYEPRWAAEGRMAIFERHFRERPPVVATDLHGNPTMSAAHLMQFRDWLVQRASAETGRRIVNATGDGLLYGGRIQQAALSSLSRPGSPVAAGATWRVTADAWRVSATARRSAAVGSWSTLIGQGGAGLPLDDWREFTDGAVATEAITAALGTAESQWDLVRE